MPRDESAVHVNAVVSGLSTSEAASSVDRYFEAVRWEPPVFDPEFLTVSVFFAMVLAEASKAPDSEVEDVVQSVEWDELEPFEEVLVEPPPAR